MSPNLVPAGLRLTAPVGRIVPLFEDDALLVIDKPAGLAVHGGAGETGATVLEALESAYGQPVKLHLVHRLDKGTSGVLLISKRPELVPKLAAQWDQVDKRYWAVALGNVAAQTISKPLADNDGRPMPSQSQLTPLVALPTEPAATLVGVRILTGRKHQIRRHLAGVGHPILMDDQYGDFGANKTWRRFMSEHGLPRPKHPLLHAARLVVPHPWTGDSLRCAAPLPESWRGLLALAQVDEASVIS